jgi:hypothetical protein
MRILTGIGSLLSLGTFAVALIAWLSSRPDRISRRAGLVLAVAVGAFCLVTVLALVADNGIGPQLRIGGLLAVLSFTLIGTAAITIACHALPPRSRAPSSF